MPQFQRRSYQIEAEQWLGQPAVLGVRLATRKSAFDFRAQLVVTAADATYLANMGDWICRDEPTGCLYVMDPKSFEETFAAVREVQ